MRSNGDRGLSLGCTGVHRFVFGIDMTYTWRDYSGAMRWREYELSCANLQNVVNVGDLLDFAIVRC